MKKTILVMGVILIQIMCGACAKSEDAQEVDKLIATIGEVTLDNEESIIVAENAVTLLDKRELKQLENLDLLKVARDEYYRLVEERNRIEKEKEDALIATVEIKISEIGKVTINSEKAIQEAKKAYEELDSMLQPRVKNKDAILEAEKALVDARINHVEKAIDAIGTVTTDSETYINYARKIYNGYKKDIQSCVSNYNKLEEAENTLSELKINNVISMINNIGKVTLESKTDLDNARVAYGKLSYSEKQLVTNYSDLEEADKAYLVLLEEEEKKEAKKILRVTKVECSEPDSAGGVSLYINFENKSKKTIKYIVFGVVFYNAVDDVVVCKYKRDIVNRCRDTGPYETGRGLKGYGTYWGKFYNNSIERAELDLIEIEYMDGTEISLSKKQIEYVQY